ncbi:MAG: OmpA family protein, partial [Saprospiraceae bacterium]|nr:OmpA family protein [Saprospiraceae bacterium]
LYVNKEKYLFHSENFNLTETATLEKPFLLDIDLEPIPLDSVGHVTGKPVILRNVFFETGSAALRPESTAELDRLLELLNSNAGLRIQINGHTDNVGTDASNQQLSEARAKAVYDYLCTKGLQAARLRYKGFGESQPLDSNDTVEGRTSNRRTEFILW